MNMKPLILKDLLTLKKQSKILLAMIAFYSVFGIVLDSSFFVGAMPVLMLSLLTITTFSYDDLAKWDAFALTMPITRRDLVRSKYALALVVMLGGLAFSLVLTGVNCLVHNSPVNVELIASLISYLFTGMLFNSLLLPLIYKMGVEQARIGLLLIVAVPVIGFITFTNLGYALPVIPEATIKALLIAAPFAIIALFVLSYRLSLSFCLKRVD